MALAPDGAVVAAGVSDTPDGRQPVITLTGASAAAQRVDIAKIPGAVEPQVAVNSIAANTADRRISNRTLELDIRLLTFKPRLRPCRAEDEEIRGEASASVLGGDGPRHQ